MKRCPPSDGIHPCLQKRFKKKTLIISLIVVAVAVFMAVWLFWQRPPAPTEIDNPAYTLVADGELNSAVVRISDKDRRACVRSIDQLLLIDLGTGQCKRPRKMLASVDKNIVLLGAPTGQTVVWIGKTNYLQHLRDLPSFKPKEIAKYGWTYIQLHEYDVSFYYPHTDSLSDYPKLTSDSTVYEAGWLPGTDRLVIFEYPDKNDNTIASLFDSNGKTTFSVLAPKRGFISPKVGRNHLFFENESYKPHRINGLWVFSTDDEKMTYVTPPDDFTILGWSPDGRYLTLTESHNNFRYAWGSCVDGCGKYITTNINVWDPSQKQSAEGVQANSQNQEKKDHLSIVLWDRLTDTTSPLFDVPINLPKGKYEDYGPTWFLTSQGLLYFQTNMLDDAHHHAIYYDLSGKTPTRQFDLFLLNQAEDVFVASVSPDGRFFLLNLFKKDVPNNLTNEEHYDEAEPKWSRTLALLDVTNGAMKKLPLDDLNAVLMQDGTVLAIQGDDLVRYDPTADTKRVIVENLFETWQALGEAQKQD